NLRSGGLLKAQHQPNPLTPAETISPSFTASHRYDFLPTVQELKMKISKLGVRESCRSMTLNSHLLSSWTCEYWKWSSDRTLQGSTVTVLGDELDSQGPGGEGDAGFACPNKERRGIRGAKVGRLSKALVGPAGVLAPVNQAVIEEQSLGLNVAPLTV
ncbi:hypothetical protein KUCAC02_011716, partial [Chaenocephalus aceratus]